MMPFEEFHRLVQIHKRFVLTTHVNPDGDGLGSQIALAAMLRARTKDVRIINCHPTPPYYRFLDPSGQIELYNPPCHNAAIHEADVIIIVDTSDSARLRTMQGAVDASPALKIVIDHHPEPVVRGAVVMVDIDATSTGEIIYTLIAGTDPSLLTPEVSTALYTAIMTDTGSFRFPKTDPETHRIAADLISRGADPSKIYDAVYDQGPINRLRLLGRMLSGISMTPGGLAAYAVITQKMFDETLTSPVDTDSFINYTLGIGGVRIGLLFVELPGEIKISFRSKGTIPINELAKEFGGNGHMNAAGARVIGSRLEDVTGKVLSALDRFIIELRLQETS